MSVNTIGLRHHDIDNTIGLRHHLIDIVLPNQFTGARSGGEVGRDKWDSAQKRKRAGGGGGQGQDDGGGAGKHQRAGGGGDWGGDGWEGQSESDKSVSESESNKSESDKSESKSDKSESDNSESDKSEGDSDNSNSESEVATPSFCGTCCACTFTTENSWKSCMYGSQCTRVKCWYAHARKTLSEVTFQQQSQAQHYDDCRTYL